MSRADHPVVVKGNGKWTCVTCGEPVTYVVISKPGYMPVDEWDFYGYVKASFYAHDRRRT